MMKKIILGVAAVVALILIYAAFSPAEYSIQREVVINAPAEKIFPYLNNQKLAEQWGPWLETDPSAKMTYSGPDEGVGAIASWTGGQQLGTGSATIVDSIPNQKVTIKLAYTEPFQMEQLSDYIAEAAGEQTKVIWKVTGQNNFIGRVMCIFVSMDKMVGGMFEEGLNKLKTVIEGGA